MSRKKKEQTGSTPFGSFGALKGTKQMRSPPPGLKFKNSNPEERKLRNYKDSDYALNRYSQGIVYNFRTAS